MFTGLVTELGAITAITRGESSAVFTIKAPASVAGLAVGDSIAVNGVCLTATSLTADSFTADVMVQTLNLTSLSQVEAGSQVNLELAAQMDMRMGGHIVQGHVDGIAKIAAISADSQWTRMDLAIPKDLMKYVVAQGSICLEGVSLTVGEINDPADQISVWLIPETLAKTNLSKKSLGENLNVEVDVLAKYVERLIARGQEGK